VEDDPPQGDSPFESGTRSLDDRYQLIKRIGQGGMGEVWKAQDRAASREVAIKFPRNKEGLAGAEHWLAAEAHTVARLSHPHVVSLLDRTTLPGQGEEGLPALVFSYVSGKPLTLWCDRPRPWRWVRWVAEQMLDALAYAHGRGVVHLDLKPSNVLLSGDAREPWINLLDFGIAAWSAPGRAGAEDTEPRTSGYAGTRAYMAPEQAQGERGDIGPWTDLYGLGVVLTQLLIGTMPFPGETDELLWSHRLRSRFTPPVQALADLGVPLRRFLLRLLAPDPAQRFGWAADARRSLPPAETLDLTTDQSAFDPGHTDVLEAVRRPEERDTDPETDPDTDFAMDASMSVGGLGSITLELAPADDQEVALPSSWAVDRPDPAAWKTGLDHPSNRRRPAPVPAVSYSLLSMRDAPLEGRDEEWRSAWEHIGRVSTDRRPVLLLVEGAQGRGKTRFARELAAVAEELGVARSHHVRFRGDGSGAGALRRLLHRVLRIAQLTPELREERVRRVLGEAGYPSEADLVPRLLAILSPGQRPEGPAREEAVTALELFRVLGRRRPLLLWLEDIDRARDQALVSWLELLFQSEGDVPVVVVATARDDRAPGDDDDESPEWVLLRADPRTQLLPMEPLTDKAVASMLSFTAGVSETLGGEVARWCRGDPRAAQQIARHLHETNRLVWTPKGFELRGDTPSTAGYLRLDSILRVRARDAVRGSNDPQAFRAALDLLSLVRERARHRDFTAAALAIGMPARRIDSALAPLVMAALVDVRDEGPRLAHTALAESISAAMDPERRTRLHRAWAVVLEARTDGTGRAERLLEAASNRDACSQHPEAASDELEAAHLLRDRREYGAAWRAVQQARHRVADHPDALGEAQHADLQVLAAVLDHEVSEGGRSTSSLSAELDMLQPLWIMLEAGEIRCRCDLVHAEALRRAGRPADAGEAVDRALDSARGAGLRRWECRALVLSADLLRLQGKLPKASRMLEDAWALARGLDDEALTRSVLQVRLPLEIGRSDEQQARLDLDKLRGLLRARASWSDLQTLWQYRGEVERLAGSHEAARRAYDTALVLGRRRRLANAPILLKLAALHLSETDIPSARSCMEEAGRLGEKGPRSHEVRASEAVLNAEVALRSGDADGAARALQDAEILLAQSPLAVPILLRSLERAVAAASGSTRERVQSLATTMADRLR
jgi:serine/threonine protein kinase